MKFHISPSPGVLRVQAQILYLPISSLYEWRRFSVQCFVVDLLKGVSGHLSQLSLGKTVLGGSFCFHFLCYFLSLSGIPLPSHISVHLVVLFFLLIHQWTNCFCLAVEVLDVIDNVLNSYSFPIQYLNFVHIEKKKGGWGLQSLE